MSSAVNAEHHMAHRERGWCGQSRPEVSQDPGLEGWDSSQGAEVSVYVPSSSAVNNW